MSMTLYFAKLNLISDDIFKLYDDPKQRTAIAFALYEAIKSNTRWEKENFFIDDNGEQHSTIIEYSAHILKTDDAFNYIEGWLRFLYKGIIIKHNKTEPTYTKTSLFLCEKRRFFMARTEKGVVATI